MEQEGGQSGVRSAALKMVSFSDAHSPEKLGRESTIFSLTKMSYKNILNAIRGKGKDRIKETIEVDPSWGKYHEDGHRKCGIMMTPEQAMKNKNTCPRCKKPLTLGVHHRVEELADRPASHRCSDKYRKLIPLKDVLAHALRRGRGTKTVDDEYKKLIKGSSELDVLINRKDLGRFKSIIMKNRNGKLKISPGYDGKMGELE